MNEKKVLTLFSGRSHPKLAQEIAGYLGIQLGKVKIEDFPDGEIGVQILENVRGKDVFIVQSLARAPNLYLMELLILVDALKRASAKSITAVLPYYCYARQDRKDKGRVPITARLVADLLEKAGVTRVVTMDLHTEQIQGFFNIPLDNLYARKVLVESLREMKLEECVVVTPDIGSVKLARAFASDLKADIAIVNKRRLDAERVEANALIGEVAGRDVVLVDDIYSTGGTLQKASRVCKALGAKRIFAAVTHGLMIGDAIIDSPVEKLLITDTVVQKDELHSKIQVVSVAKHFALALESILEARSISSMYQSL